MNVTLRRGIAAAAVTMALPALSACLPGNFGAATDQVYNPTVGANDRSGDVKVLDAMVVAGEDGAGTVVAGLANIAAEPDVLTSVTGAGESAAITVEAGTTEIPADGFVQLADSGDVQVTGEQVQQGYFVELRFAFENAEAVDIQVPVVPRRDAYAEIPVPEAGRSAPVEGDDPVEPQSE